MRRWDFLPELPPDHVVVEGRRGVLVCRADWREALVGAGLGPDEAPALTAAVEVDDAPRGRQPVALLTLGEATLVVRSYTHGGMFRWLTGDRFGDPARPFQELVLAGELLRRGVPTAEVIAARAQRAGRFGWWLCLVTRRVEGALDGGIVLRRLATGALPVACRHAVTNVVGELVGGLHAVGLWHADLTPNNMLFGEEVLRGESPRCWILDLDRSSLRAALTDEQRGQNLERFLRSVVKRQQTVDAGLDRTDAVRFLRGYARGRGRPESSWREDFRVMARLWRRGRLAHWTGWFLEQVFAAGGPSRRAS